MGGPRARAEALLTRPAVRRAVGGAQPVYRQTRGAASCGLVVSVAEIEETRAACYIGASNPILGFLPRSWGSLSYESGQNAGAGQDEDGPRGVVP